MAYWLLKTEPEAYSWDDLVRERKTVWDGVTNTLALKHIRTIAKGDLALIYHTGDERQAIGIAEVTSKPYADPSQDNEKLAVMDLKPKRKLVRPVTLSEMKADQAFADWVFLRNGRLSVVPTPDDMWNHILQLAGEK